MYFYLSDFLWGIHVSVLGKPVYFPLNGLLFVKKCGRSSRDQIAFLATIRNEE